MESVLKIFSSIPFVNSIRGHTVYYKNLVVIQRLVRGYEFLLIFDVRGISQSQARLVSKNR